MRGQGAPSGLVSLPQVYRPPVQAKFEIPETLTTKQNPIVSPQVTCAVCGKGVTDPAHHWPELCPHLGRLSSLTVAISWGCLASCRSFGSSNGSVAACFFLAIVSVRCAQPLVANWTQFLSGFDTARAYFLDGWSFVCCWIGKWRYSFQLTINPSLSLSVCVSVLMLRSKDQENEFHSLPLLTHISNLHEVAIRENPLPQDPATWTTTASVMWKIPIVTSQVQPIPEVTTKSKVCDLSCTVVLELFLQLQ